MTDIRKKRFLPCKNTIQIILRPALSQKHPACINYSPSPSSHSCTSASSSCSCAAWSTRVSWSSGYWSTVLMRKMPPPVLCYITSAMYSRLPMTCPSFTTMLAPASASMPSVSTSSGTDLFFHIFTVLSFHIETGFYSFIIEKTSPPKKTRLVSLYKPVSI